MKQLSVGCNSANESETYVTKGNFFCTDYSNMTHFDQLGLYLVDSVLMLMVVQKRSANLVMMGLARMPVVGLLN